MRTVSLERYRAGLGLYSQIVEKYQIVVGIFMSVVEFLRRGLDVHFIVAAESLDHRGRVLRAGAAVCEGDHVGGAPCRLPGEIPTTAPNVNTPFQAN